MQIEIELKNLDGSDTKLSLYNVEESPESVCIVLKQKSNELIAFNDGSMGMEIEVNIKELRTALSKISLKGH